MLTVSSWPKFQCENQYLALYYGALAKHGITLGPACVIQDDFLRKSAGAIDAIHIQWVPEQIWRCRGNGFWARLRGMLGFRKYLKLARSLGIRVVWTLHDIEHHEGNGWLDEQGYKLLARWADLTIVHDDWAADQFVKRLGGDPHRVVVMEHGNYDGVFPPAGPRSETLTRLGIDLSRRVLLCQGSVRPYKGYRLAVEAAAKLGPAYHVIVAGKPNEPAFGAELREAAKGVANVTLLLESQTEQAMSDLFAAADCFLLPYSKITGSGSLLTTCTLGRGFVASDLPYFRRSLEQEPEAGELFPAGSVDGLAAAVERFFAIPAEARHRAARRIADRVPWFETVRPVVDWFRAEFPGRLDAPALAAAGG